MKQHLWVMVLAGCTLEPLSVDTNAQPTTYDSAQEIFDHEVPKQSNATSSLVAAAGRFIGTSCWRLATSTDTASSRFCPVISDLG